MAIRGAAALLAAGLAFAAGAQDKYPSKTVTVIVPQAAAGANDAIARVIAQKLGEQTSQSFIVDNRPGAGGNIGTVAAPNPNPTAIPCCSRPTARRSSTPSLYKRPRFDPLKDFVPIAPVATAGYVLVADTGFAPNDVAELIAVAKARSGKITIASAGNGTLNHLIGAMLQKAAGIELQHIPYKGSAASVTDTVAGQVQVSVQSLPSSLSFIKSGKLKVLGVVNEKRVAALPDAPTIGETIKGFGATPWCGPFAPAGTPKEIVTELQASVAKALDDKDTQEKLDTVGCAPFKGTSEQLAALVASDLPRWAKIVKDSGASID